jgi:hypothetical protein
MTGIPEHNFPAFNNAERLLREHSFVHIINPAAFGVDPSFTWQDYLHRDLLELLNKCTDVLVLSGFENSRGARLELLVAHEMGMEVWTNPALTIPLEYTISINLQLTPR